MGGTLEAFEKHFADDFTDYGRWVREVPTPPLPSHSQLLVRYVAGMRWRDLTTTLCDNDPATTVPMTVTTTLR